MIGRVVGLAVGLIDDDPFGPAIFPRHFRMHVVLAIAASREDAFTILKISSTDIPRQRLSMPGFYGFESVPCHRRDGVAHITGVRLGTGSH